MELKLSYGGLFVFAALTLLSPAAAAQPEHGPPSAAPSQTAVTAPLPVSAVPVPAPEQIKASVPVIAKTTEAAPEQKVPLAAVNASDKGALLEKNDNIMPTAGTPAAEIGLEQKAEMAVDNPADKRPSALIVPPLSISLDPDDHKGNRAVERSFHLYTVNIRKNFTRWLERSSRYMEVMKEVLKEKDMPQELVYLPFVESGFNNQAYSRARAAGPWQFISGTAKRYGLTIDWWRDERKDPIKSTAAAAAYLRDLYEMFGSWDLALAAYNAGEGRIAKALRRSDAEDIWDLLGTKHIRQETKDYVPRFIAASVIASKPQEYGFTDIDFHAPFEYDEVTLDTPVDLDVIADCADTTVQEIRELNPELRRWSTPPNMKNYTVRIPKGTKEDFLENMAEYEPEERFSCDYYTVRKKDTVRTVAKKAGVPLATLLALNNLSGIERLSPGEKIMVPPKGKYFLDIDDRMSARKVSLKKKKGKGGKAVVKTAKGSAKGSKAKASNKKPGKPKKAPVQTTSKPKQKAKTDKA